MVALAVTAGALSFGGTASASCGDYLTIKNAKPGTTPAMPADHDGSGKVPCHGPNCSLGGVPDQPPISSAPFKLTPPQSDPAALDAGAEDSASTRAKWRLVESRFATVSRPFAPFHPPKSV